jgi:hypothetical protein
MTPLRSSAPAIVLLASAAACSAVTDRRSCTALGCQDGLQIDFQASTWPQGAYRFDVDADGRSTVCACALPLSPSGPNGGCNDAGVLLGQSGSMLPAAQQSLTGLIFHSHPKKVRIVASRDGVSLADRTFDPQYQKLQPNGPECEPTCSSAHAAMSW